jgi:hypothetical protein
VGSLQTANHPWERKYVEAPVVLFYIIFYLSGGFDFGLVPTAEDEDGHDEDQRDG